jgi:glycosyl hydrolase family 36
MAKAKAKAKVAIPSFAKQARHILELEIDARINALGGYGPDGEAIYERHPDGCPSVLVDHFREATATFMSNGSTAFLVRIPEGMEVDVLEGSFDPVEKHETGVPSANLWLDVAAGKRHHLASLMNPCANLDCRAQSTRIVKLGDPDRSMWYCAAFAPTRGLCWETAVKHSLACTSRGPAILRQVYIRNTGRKKLSAKLWSYWHLKGTQRFVYNKEIWYDKGLALSGRETVVSANVPYSDIVQIKRVASLPRNMKPTEATCDYATFVGDSAALSLLPEALRRGEMLPGSSGRQMNRFATATIAANRFDLALSPDENAVLEQELLYVLDPAVQARFRKLSDTTVPTYRGIAAAFRKAASAVVKSTPGVKDAVAARLAPAGSEPWPVFEFALRDRKAISEYAKSVWTGVAELYENCRAHGAMLAEGIELGTRDRAQDMWPKLKEDPARVRGDLVHALSFMYVTQALPLHLSRPLKLEQKLHGMFPRQYPSRWDDRSKEVMNDNRPYADSPLWLVNSLMMYIRETGDTSVLSERVKTVQLSDPRNPEKSGIVGCDVEYSVVEVVFEIFASFARMMRDTPYGMAQILYGDWCDPVDMFGTSEVGNDRTRGKGRGVQTRLSCHLFECLVETVDVLEAPGVTEPLEAMHLEARIRGLKNLANRLRANIVKWAWESGPLAGFIDCIHELKTSGRKPNYSKGDIGYTLGSMRGRDFDGINRRQLASQSYGLKTLLTDRPWLKTPKHRDAMVRNVLKTTDELFYDEKLGLVMFSAAVANNQKAVDLVGRLGMFPAGCGENGEYHHCQVMMHRNRLAIPGQNGKVWQQFPLVMSAMRDEGICGPFESPTNCYVADPTDPHFAKGMYFGLSGSVDWIVEIFQSTVGLQLALHDRSKPDIRVEPNMPESLGEELRLRRIVHCTPRKGAWRQVPVEVILHRTGSGPRMVDRKVLINGQPAAEPEIRDLGKFKKVSIEITSTYRR